ncbi:hypothetical protein ASG90_19625 [Nocardioides sp. Soil797]|nr:hypothetical protein ASG90_19625 [Nocardioides sp. Soil797]
MTSIGFLHTAQAHVATFDDLTHRLRPLIGTLHVVDESLLVRARVDGIDSVGSSVEVALEQLRQAGADVIVCTCSTIGDLAERVARDVVTLRVDRPMARTAVDAAERGGRRIGVIAALESTLAPTRRLLEAEAAASSAASGAAGPTSSGTVPAVELVLVPGAWAEFEAGNTEAYLHLVADAARELADRVDVVVLSQASMAAAELLLTDVDVPVLSSPSVAVSYVLTQLE